MNQAECLKLLSELKIKYELVEHKAVFTIAEAMSELQGRTEIKNLFSQDDKGRQLYLVIMPGLKKLDLKNLAKDLDEKKVRFCNPQKVENILGVKPGSVSLFCCLNENAKEVKIIFDKDLLDEPELGFHPIVNTSTVFISPKDIKKLIESLGNDYSITEL